MLNETPLRFEHLQRASRLSSLATALPAVATHDWCEQTARMLVPIAQPGICVVMITRVDESEQVRLVEASGAAGVDARGTQIQGEMIRPEGSAALGWSLPRPVNGPQGAPIRSLACNDEFWRGPSGRRWWGFGTVDLLVASAAVGPVSSMRRIQIELGCQNKAQLTPADADVIRAMLEPLADRAHMAFGNEPITATNRLTAREQEVLELLTWGMSVKDIASHLARSPHTVHDHVKSLHRKLRASSRGALVARALGHPVGRAPMPAAEHEAKPARAQPMQATEAPASRLATA